MLGRNMQPSFITNRFTVNSPSNAQITTLLETASIERSTTKISLLWVPAPIIESPSARTKKRRHRFFD